MVFVHRLAEVPALLLVPPVGVRVTELALDAGRVDEAAVHFGVLSGSEGRIIRVGVLLVDLGLADHGLGEEKIASPSPTPAPPSATTTNGDNAHNATDTTITNGNINGITNGTRRPRDEVDDNNPDADGQQPPAKRARVRDTTTPPPANTPKSKKPKIESPPWKKIEAEGPTTFVTEDGRRKSGRINLVPLAVQSGDKRITRGQFQQSSPPRVGGGSRSTTASGTASKRSTPATSTSTSTNKHVSSKSSATAKQPPTRKFSTHDSKSGNTRSRRRSPSPRRPTTPTKQPSRGTRRSTRHIQNTDDYDGDIISPGGTLRTPRSKVNRPPLTAVPLVHRDQAVIRPRIGQTFEEYFERANDIPVEQGGLFVPAEDGPRYTDDMAREDALVIMRVEKEVEPGGILAEEKCSVFEPEPEEEPPRQWAHLDHLTKAMSNFRRLMLIEQQRHRATAKRIAIACEAEWRRRNPQPKTAEEIEREEMEKSKARWCQVAKTIAGTWENVKAEVNRRRMVEWEAEEQRRVKAALNQAVNLSEQKLQARQARNDTEGLSDDEEDEDDDMASGSDIDDDDDATGDDSGDNDEGSEADNESNMSSSEDEDDKESVLSDEGLTQEQLREKYADLPALESKDNETEEAEGGAPLGETTPAGPTDVDDTSDESVDMDDDMGSSSDGSDGDDDEEEDGSEEDEESDDEPTGLLGLFFKKSELKKLKAEAPVEEGDQKPEADAEVEPEQKDTEMAGVDQAIAEPQSDVPAEALQEDDEKIKDQQPSLADAPAPQENHIKEVPLVNGTSDVHEPHSPSQPSQRDEPEPKEEPVEDVSMTDAPPLQEVPDVEISDASAVAHHASPETEPITNTHSTAQSQSPRASDDTKPSEVETPASESQLVAAQADSRYSSPPPSNAQRTEIPFLLRGTLREYQHLGLDWLAALYANNTNGILADEMGLGKTIQTIALLAHLACHHGVWGPHLVIVPTSVMLNWEMEFKKWCPGFKILTYYGNQDERKRKRQGWTNDDVWNVCITSYQMVLQDQQVFRRRRWHYMILDEAHNIKNFKSQRWQTLLGFNTHARLLLTGTPLQNNLTELWSLLYFLAPPENGEGGFVDLKEFHNWFSRPESQILESGREQLDDEARAIISKLHKVLRPYLLRRLKADVEKQMPAKYEHVEFCRLSKRQRELYDGFLSRADTRETLASGNYMSIINCLMQLRKVCNHPDLFVDRPIMTSFRMKRSVPADFDVKEQIVRKKLLAEKLMGSVSLSFLNMIPTQYENMSSMHADRISQLSTHRILLDLREAQKTRANNAYHTLDPATIKSNIVYLESAARWGRFEELQHCVYLNALRRQQRPIYGKRLVEMLTLDTHLRPYKQRPKVPRKIMSWFEEDSHLLHNAIPTLQQRAASMETTITKFACITPAVVTGDLNKFLLGAKGIEAFEDADLRLSAPVKHAPYMPRERPQDPWHEARMRLSIQFPDKRLLQYDCGKLQALDKLLRRLQQGGHRALIFTQMTKVLDILEQFLNIHGHKYLRLDGATKVEQRQILTDRFNHDPRILCFILSTRSGGLGINLTGADTVIFYDQDWNPAMDKQCQDRCHRIGQTRDVHIYRLVSEHTIEANILRKAGQKQMLDDVVIQEGEFTTEEFNKLSVRDVVRPTGEVVANENDVAANAAMDRVLGGVETGRDKGRALEGAEDREDVAAARVAEKEIQDDEVDFDVEQQQQQKQKTTTTTREGTKEPEVESGQEEGEAVEYNAFGGRMWNVDEYMLKFMTKALEGTPLELPRDKNRSKRGRKRAEDHGGGGGGGGVGRGGGGGNKKRKGGACLGRDTRKR
ncbi:helicase swr-1 [Cladorrhinum sp. PSN332]|nr:helicase swr-1 [Cladorrhinum sp. PSN332]